MPRTTLSDVFVPETFRSYQIEEPVIKSALVQSGILVNTLNDEAQNSGFVTTVPFWHQIDSTIEPNYSNDVYTDIAEPQKVNTGEMVSRISDLNEGFSAADLVTALSGADPLKFVAAHIDQFWVEQMQKRLIATAVGLYAENAAGPKDMIVDVSSPDMTVTAANKFSVNSFTRAVMSLGDSFAKLTGMAMHSMVYSNLLENDEIEFIKDSEGNLNIATYKGKTVLIDDGMPIIGGDGTTVAFKYLTVLFGVGAFGYGVGTPKVPSEFEREPARANGGGFETLWSRKRWIIHPQGYTFKSASITGPGLSPTWANLRNPANWERISNRKNVRLAFLVSNA